MRPMGEVTHGGRYRRAGGCRWLGGGGSRGGSRRRRKRRSFFCY